MSLLKLILTVLIAITPANYRPAANSARMTSYEAIAQDIDSAVASPISGYPFDGPAAKEATAIALASIAMNESGMREEVRDCRIKGDSGRSISVFQLIAGPGRKGYAEKDICSDHVLAARLGLNALTWYKNVSAPINLFQGYATGNVNGHSWGARNQHQFFMSQLVASNVKLSTKPGVQRLIADYIAPPVVLSANDADPSLRTAALTP